MRTILTISLLISALSLFGQSKEKVDSTVQELCHFLTNLETTDPEVKSELIWQKIKAYMNQSDHDDPQEAGLRIVLRLEKYCLPFQDLMEQLHPTPGGSQRFTEMPESSISKKQIKAFQELNSFYYLDGTDTVKVMMQNGKWQDHFPDGTTSKCTYQWSGNNTFHLIFQESNNEVRKALSYPGEEYHYTLYAFEDGCYKTALFITGVEGYRFMPFCIIK